MVLYTHQQLGESCTFENFTVNSEYRKMQVNYNIFSLKLQQVYTEMGTPTVISASTSNTHDVNLKFLFLNTQRA
jgi:hypothetical protein